MSKTRQDQGTSEQSLRSTIQHSLHLTGQLAEPGAGTRRGNDENNVFCSSFLSPHYSQKFKVVKTENATFCFTFLVCLDVVLVLDSFF